MSLQTPVLYLIFNRPEQTRATFDVLRKMQPAKLYVASDGPRTSRPGENGIVKNVREIVLKNIDWPCEVKTLLRDENLGCKRAVSSAIDWFFKNEEKGIILEDDCLPTPGFFRYCEELLLRYENDNAVWHISGDNFQDGNQRGSADYYFSNYPHIWGWATWRSRWKSYDVDLTTLTETQARNVSERVFGIPFLIEHWVKTMMDTKAGKIDTWDYQWMYAVWLNEGLCVLPNSNLISNLGFGQAATHTTGADKSLANLPTADLSFPLKHPDEVVRNVDADDYTARRLFKPRSFLGKIKEQVKSWINE